MKWISLESRGHRCTRQEILYTLSSTLCISIGLTSNVTLPDIRLPRHRFNYILNSKLYVYIPAIISRFTQLNSTLQTTHIHLSNCSLFTIPRSNNLRLPLTTCPPSLFPIYINYFSSMQRY